MKNDRHLLVLLLAIYLFAIVVVVVGAGSQAITAFFSRGVNQEWLGFTGSIIGGLITAGAGVAAWMAAQRTIDVTRGPSQSAESMLLIASSSANFLRRWKCLFATGA